MRPVTRLVGGVLGFAALFAASAAFAAPAVPLAAEPFDLADVTLGPGPFRDALQRDRAYLLSLEPDRLLHTFRLNVGLPSTAKPYGGWEAPGVELRGHTLGHYLSACALMYRSTGDRAFKDRIDEIVGVLAQCQAASPKAGFHEGYLSAFPESFIDRVEQGKEVWAPWYTLHKIMAGLFDSYQLAGNQQALDVLKKMARWAQARVDRLTPAQMQASLKNEQGGITEVLANLYGVTGNPDDLRLAQAFEHHAVIDPLARGEDDLTGLHANTQIPKIIGAAREFELTGEERYRKIAETFWTDVALERSYVIGGDSDREHFFPPADFEHHVTAETAETCNTYNMLKLTRHLFEWAPDARLMDFYERALYNHILASQDPAQGMFVYLMSLQPGHFKTYSTADNSFWCCVGTGMENHAKYGDTIFAHNASTLFVNLFIPSEVNWRERGVKLRQETTFPQEDSVRLVVSCGKPTSFDLRIRHPAWATGAVEVMLNGQPQTIASQPGSYFTLRREWRDGDTVQLRLPLRLHVEKLPNSADLVALLYGPIVLAGELGIDGMPSPYAANQLDLARFPDPEVPAFVTNQPDWLQHVEMISRSPLVFRTHGLARPDEVTLVPFYQVQHQRYSVYWKLLTPQAWEQAQAGRAATESAWKTLETTGADKVEAGNAGSEAEHGFQVKGSVSGTLSGHSWREAQNGDYFSYELAAPTAGPLALVCVRSNTDTVLKYSVQVGEGTVLASPTVLASDSTYVVERYVVPREAIGPDGRLRVKFQAENVWDAATANLFTVALVRENP